MKLAVVFRAWDRFGSRAAGCLALLLLPVLLLGLGGCGVSPEGVAEEFVSRFAEHQFENLDHYVAADQRAEFREFLAQYQAALQEPKGPGQELQSRMVLDIDGIESEVVSEGEQTARVRLNIELDIQGPDKGLPFLTTPNQALAVTRATAEGSLDVMLVKEKGRWMVDVLASTQLWDEALNLW